MKRRTFLKAMGGAFLAVFVPNIFPPEKKKVSSGKILAWDRDGLKIIEENCTPVKISGYNEYGKYVTEVVYIPNDHGVVNTKNIYKNTCIEYEYVNNKSFLS
jgi:hypothetical protein